MNAVNTTGHRVEGPQGDNLDRRDSRLWILKIGSVAGSAGALVGMVGNLLHPATPIGDAEGVANTIATSEIWVIDHLAIVIALIMMLGGLVAISRSIEGGVAGAVAKLAYVAAVSGATVGLILVTLDGLAAKHLATAWAEAPPEEAAIALRLVAAEETINFALASLFNILFAGVTFGLYGIAVVLSRIYPRWLGWVVVVAGGGSVVAGLIQAAAGTPTPVTRVLTIIFPTIITLWLAVMGVLVWRRAASLEAD